MIIVASAIVSACFLIGWINHLRFERSREAVRAKTERFNKVIDHFGDSNEFIQFVESERGISLLSALTSPATSTKIPILIMLCTGLISLAIGLGAAILTFSVDDDFIFGAVFMSMTALGLFTAAGVSYRLSKSWGIFEDTTTDIFPQVASYKQTKKNISQ